MNISKSYQIRFWKKWEISGAIQKPIKPYVHPSVTCPPPTLEVALKISQISDLLTRLIGFVESASIESDKKRQLLEELTDARYQACNCEYHLAKEYLERVLPDEHSELSSVRKRILRVFDFLDWCRDHDRRISYSWVKAPLSKAA
jgi:hypothetical protein